MEFIGVFFSVYVAMGFAITDWKSSVLSCIMEILTQDM